MSNSVTLQQAVIKGVASLFGNDDALKKLLTMAKKLKKESRNATEELTAKEKEEVLDDIRESLKELSLVKQGKQQSRPVAELINEL